MLADASTNTLLIAAIGAAATIIAALVVTVAPIMLHRLSQIHVLVNSNLDALKMQVEQLEADIRRVVSERDAAQAITDKVVTATDAAGEAIRYVEENRPL